jgi:hypothetical protein
VFPSSGVLVERQFITVADDEAVRAVEIGYAAGSNQRGFVVEGDIKGRVAGGG